MIMDNFRQLLNNPQKFWEKLDYYDRVQHEVKLGYITKAEAIWSIKHQDDPEPLYNQPLTFKLAHQIEEEIKEIERKSNI